MLFLPDRQVGVEVVFMVEGHHPEGTPSQVYRDGAITALQASFLSLGSTGPSVTRFTPVSSGLHTVVLADGSIAAQVDVVPRSSLSYLRNIEDEALGSWTWNRVDGTLQLLRQDGSELANFAVIDTQTESSRERLL